jgi:hypothetical protein
MNEHCNIIVTHGSLCNSWKLFFWAKNVAKMGNEYTCLKACNIYLWMLPSDGGICMVYGDQSLITGFVNYIMTQVIKARRLRQMVHLCRIQEQDPCRKLIFHKTEGTRPVVYNLGYAYPRGYVKLKKINILFHDKHWIIRARFRVSHKRPRCKDMRFGSAIFFSLSPLCDSYLGG